MLIIISFAGINQILTLFAKKQTKLKMLLNLYLPIKRTLIFYLTVISKMKNKGLKGINFKLLNHRITKIKSNAFLKLVLYSEESDHSVSSESAGCSNYKILEGSLVKVESSLSREMIRVAFENIKFAGWKLIPQALTDQEQDSVTNSIINLDQLSQKSLSILPKSERILGETSNLPYFHQFQSEKVSPLDRSKIFKKDRSSRDITNDTSQASSKQMKLKKRALIMKKFQNIEMCIDYISYCDRYQKRPYHYG